MGTLKRIILGLFLAASLANLWGNYAQNIHIMAWSKPLLMPLLALWLLLTTGIQGRKGWLRNGVLVGLLASWVGDILLPEHFLPGLLSFLTAHLLYISAFASWPAFRSGYIFQRQWLVLPFLLFIAGFNIYLYDYVPAALRLPVAVYSIIIISMTLAALNLRGLVITDTFRWLIAGALLFVASDSILAIGKFQVPDSNLGVAIMLTYIAGQFGIAKGVASAISVLQEN